MLGQGTGRGRTTLWPQGGQRADALPWPASWTRLTQSLPITFKEWALADVAPGRLVPWLPVAFGAGIALYFAAEHEPLVWAAAALTLTCVASAMLLRRRAVAFPIALAFSAISAGFAIATLRTASIAHPVLAAPATLTISGWVEVREERERSDRIVVRAHRVEGERLAQTLVRVRVAVRKGTAPAVAAFVEMRALGAAARSLASGRANTRP